MHRFSPLMMIALLLAGLGVQARAQTSCTNLCLQQTTCSGNTTTSITGKVFAPNGTDPLPNVTVYIPNAPVEAFTPGVSCPTVGAAPSGSPLVGTITAVDGSFTLSNAPVGTAIPIVAVSGRWRIQSTVNTTACVSTTANLNMPQNHLQGDIPKIAIATGAVDQVECILAKIGISHSNGNSEFTDPSGSGRINFYLGSGSNGGGDGPGSSIDAVTPTQATLMGGDSLADSPLNQYDVLMLPCQGTPDSNVDSDSKGTGKATSTLGQQELANFIAFANAGGRVYSSHYSYAWMYTNSPFNGVVNWDVGQPVPSPLNNDTELFPATINTSFTAGQTLSQWLQLPSIGASTTAGQIDIETLRHDFNGVIAPTQSWLTLNAAMGSDTNPVMQFVFNTPIATTANPTPNQCGRVLFNEYHVENGTSSPSMLFPAECNLTSPMTAQEKLLEYMLFELTSDGGQPSLAPATQDFGTEAVNYPTAAQTFTWTNNSSFPLTVSSAYITGSTNFSIVTDGCTNQTVQGGQSCTVTVNFEPTVLGVDTGTLTVVSGGFSQTAALTGTGVPGYSASTTTMSFGNVVVGDSSSQTLTLTSNASGPQALPSSQSSANYTISTVACASMIPAGGSCVATVTFTPTVLGVESGTLIVNSSGSPLTVSATGTGIPGFTLTPTTLSFGNLDVGARASQTLTLTSVAQRALATPVFTTTGNYLVSTSACGAIVPAQTSCLVTVTFVPLTTGPQSGSLTDSSTAPVYSGLNATMSGNGVDFSIWVSPNSGTVIAGDGTSTTATLTPIAGFNSALTLSCTVASGATAAACSLTPTTLTLTTVLTATASVSTTSQYTVIGYSGFGGRGWLWLLAVASGGLLWRRRILRRGGLLRSGLLVLALGTMALCVTGCSGKLPEQHAAWTGPGNYSVTVTATDGFLIHSATYNLTVTSK